jgi:predicted nuclease of predicted toxin-antitoxin system
MRLLADENFAGAAVAALRNHGHDVTWVRETSPGIGDDEVIRRAVAESRILITFDKDFGELVFRVGVSASCGVILFRIPVSSPTILAQTAVTVLESRADWAGHFSVIEETKIRLVPLP